MDDVTSLQQSLTSGISSDTINQLLIWTIVPSIILLVVFIAVYIARSVHRHKVDAAIFEIRDTLREMKAATPPAPEIKPNKIESPTDTTL